MNEKSVPISNADFITSRMSADRPRYWQVISATFDPLTKEIASCLLLNADILSKCDIFAHHMLQLN